MTGIVVLPMVLGGPGFLDEGAEESTDPPAPDTKVFISKITPIAGATPSVQPASVPDPAPPAVPPAPARKSDTAAPPPARKSATAPPPPARKSGTAPPPPARKSGTAAPPPARTAPKLAAARAVGKTASDTAKTVAKDVSDSVIERGWIVRIGTYSNPHNVTELIKTLRQQGFEPSSANIQTAKGTATRVWVGPFAQRVEAARVRGRIQQSIGEKGLIAAYP